jgi:flagellar hook-basal body complex protein FliE
MDTIGAIGSALASGLRSSAGFLSASLDPVVEDAGGTPSEPVTGVGGPEASLPGGPVAPAFGQVLSGFLRQVDGSQHQADAMVESLALGEPVDVHQVMLALNEASDAMHLTLEVRSKVLEAYQSLMQMPM